MSPLSSDWWWWQDEPSGYLSLPEFLEAIKPESRPYQQPDCSMDVVLEEPGQVQDAVDTVHNATLAI